MITELLITITLLTIVHATSSGIDIYLCDVDSPLWGCDPNLWPNPTEAGRKLCANESNIMSWVSKPVRSDAFRIFIGDEENSSPPSSYVPGEWMTVGIVKIDYEMRFRGLMIYAEDDRKSKVGEWKIFEEAPEVYHMPMSSCQKTVFHAGAAVKEGEQFFAFKAPEGTGRITFKVLIKEGDANTGAFYWPNVEGDITMTEGSASSGSDWELTAFGQSCREYCEDKDMYCDTERLLELDQEQDINDLSAFHACKLPYLSSCSVYGPSAGQDDFCYFQDSEQSCNSMGRDYSVPRCDITVSNKQRFCVCATDESADEDPRPDSDSDFDSDSEESQDGEGSGMTLRLSSIALALLVCFQSPNKKSMVLLGLLVILCLSQSVEAHNWVNSPSRSQIASTVKPHLPKTNNKPHVQVGPGQKFQVEWMTGHEGRLTYFMLVNAENAINMTQHSFAMLEEWIADAKAAGIENYAHSLYGQRLHRKSATSNGGGLGYKEQIIEGTHDNYISRPEAFTARPNTGGSLWSYNSTHREQDVRYDWENPKFPWIHSMSRFPHTFGLAGEYDVATWTIPAGLPFGKYSLQYMWAGYYDVIDIDYIDQQVEHIYGYADPTIPTTFTRIDHCYFPEIIRNGIYVPAGGYKLVSNGDPITCLEECRTKADECKYVQVVPLRVPELVRDEYKMEHGLWQTIDLPRYNMSYDQLLEGNPGDNVYVCYDLGPRVATETEDINIISNDPRDPVFYSTCYIQNEKTKFIGYDDEKPTKIDVPWRFGKRCLSCDDHARIKSSDYLVPHWTFADKCVNCDEEPSQIEVEAPKIFYKKVINESYCDGMRYDDTSDNFGIAHHKTCTNQTERCTKRLKVLGTSNDLISLKTCATLIANDPECSPYFSKYEAPGLDVEDYNHYCFCHMNKPCCHNCSPRSSANWHVYEVQKEEFKGDPECLTGTKSFDGTRCCSETCGYGQCREGRDLRQSYGFCCSDCIHRSCNEYGPPCIIEQ